MEEKMRVSSWSEAKKLGNKRYFTGKSCKHGHVAERFTCNRECVECDRLRRNRRKGKVETKLEVKNKRTVRLVRFRVVGNRRRKRVLPDIVEDKLIAVGY
jgi:hypothetical protein